MATTTQPTMAASLGRGMLAGVAGTGVMTAFQKYMEMPLTGRDESYAPARLVEKLLPMSKKRGKKRRQINYVTHYALGLMWGAAYGVAAHKGLRGQRAVGAVFAVVYSGDVLFNVALGLYKPRQWSVQDTAIDVVDKLVQAEATSVIYDNVVARKGAPNAAAA